jgi:hypothetical protein
VRSKWEEQRPTNWADIAMAGDQVTAGVLPPTGWGTGPKRSVERSKSTTPKNGIGWRGMCCVPKEYCIIKVPDYIMMDINSALLTSGVSCGLAAVIGEFHRRVS